MSDFELRLREAKTILQARWPDKFPLGDKEQDIVTKIMVEYAIQCELKIVRQQDEWQGSR